MRLTGCDSGARQHAACWISLRLRVSDACVSACAYTPSSNKNRLFTDMAEMARCLKLSCFVSYVVVISFLYDIRTIFVACWDHFEIFLRSLWIHLGSFGNCFGICFEELFGNDQGDPWKLGLHVHVLLT